MVTQTKRKKNTNKALEMIKIKSIDDSIILSFNPLFHLRWDFFFIRHKLFFLIDFIPFVFPSILCVRVQTFVTRSISIPHPSKLTQNSQHQNVLSTITI